MQILGGVVEGCVLHGIVGRLPEKVILEQRCGRSGEENHIDIREGKWQYKDPEAEVCLVCSRNCGHSL